MAFPFNFKFPHTEYHARQENSNYPYSDYHIIDLNWFVEQIKSLWEYVTEHIVSFPLTLDKGGTGATSAADARTNLGLGEVATLDRVTISKGGTNATTAAGARTNLGLGAVATDDIVPISKGGTGGATAAEARQNLGIEETTVSFPITVDKGGTNATTAAGARTNLGLGSVATEDIVPLTKGGTGASVQDKASLYNSLGVAGLDTPTAIPTTSDLNDYKTPGVYIYSNNANTANRPYASDSGTLYVVKSYIQSGSYIYQVALSYNRMYIRRFIVNTSNWSSWRQLVENTDVISITYGGTGASTASDALTNLGVFDAVYPVGSIYMSVNNTSPATLFGGTWEQLKDKFLLGAGDTYQAGNTGGEASHTLTVAELPAISGTANFRADVNPGGFRPTGVFSDGTTTNTSSSASVSGTTATEKRLSMNFGSGQAHNNMPPYLVVYMWKRTA